MFVGLDLHKNYLQAAVVDDRGTLLREERIPNTDEDIKTFSNKTLKERSEIVIESSSTWYHAYELLSKDHHVARALSLEPIS